jgi:hypothetical protein
VIWVVLTTVSNTDFAQKLDIVFPASKVLVPSILLYILEGLYVAFHDSADNISLSKDVCDRLAVGRIPISSLGRRARSIWARCGASAALPQDQVARVRDLYPDRPWTRCVQARRHLSVGVVGGHSVGSTPVVWGDRHESTGCHHSARHVSIHFREHT